MQWLNNRHSKTTRDDYKVFPEERRRQMELEQLFYKFDKDGSNALDFIEVFRMFNKYGFFITKEELMEYFKLVDLNKDFSLNLDEFKACMLDKQAKILFSKIMAQLVDRTNITEDEQNAALDEMNLWQQANLKASHPSPILPQSFQKIINLMTYLNTREEIKEILISKNISVKEQFKQLNQLILLSDNIDVARNIQPQRETLLLPSESQGYKELRHNLRLIKAKAVQRGLSEAEEYLRKQNASPLITCTKPHRFKYYETKKFKPVTSSTKGFEVSTFQHSDKRVNQFYSYINVQVPTQLKTIDTKIWNKLFQNSNQLDVVLERNKRNQMQSQKTDRLREKIQESLGRLQLNLDKVYESTFHKKTGIQLSPHDNQFLPTMNTFRHQKTTSDDKYQVSRGLLSGQLSSKQSYR